MRIASALAASLLSFDALAHAGHGMPTEWHWHATDTAGLAIVIALAGAAIWFSRGKK